MNNIKKKLSKGEVSFIFLLHLPNIFTTCARKVVSYVVFTYKWAGLTLPIPPKLPFFWGGRIFLQYFITFFILIFIIFFRCPWSVTLGAGVHGYSRHEDGI